MTAFTATFSAAVNCFGGAPTDLWNSYNWNAFKWGEGTATVPKNFTHLLVSPTITPTATADFQLTHLLASQPVASVAAINVRLIVQINGQIANSIGQAAAMGHEYVQDPQGYYRVFPEQVTDLTLSTTPNWAAGTVTPATWTTQAVQSTTWS